MEGNLAMSDSIPTLEESKAYIYSIDFSMIINKMVKHLGWSEKEGRALCAVYRNFLFLNRKYLNQYGQLPPSEELDEFWHNHILDTSKYRQDCEKIFGNYFDHYPYFGIDEKSNLDDLQNSFEMMKNLYKEEFGEEFPKITNRFSKIIALVKRKASKFL